ncbi:MAG: ATP-binding protein, partial [Terracidiphilus sp.]
MEEIGEDDLFALIENQVREDRTIEYKRELPASSETGKGKFLAGASSFANTSGGDILFGIEEEKGLPTQIVGVQSSDLDREILRLEQTMDSGLEPRIRRSFRVVNCGEGKRVVILRIDRSWSGPHRVSFQESGRFWGRNSAGKYPLDVSELRAAFTLSSTVMERIRAFRTDRIIAISNNETPVPMNPGPKVVMHCIPIESFAGQPQYDLIPFYRNHARLSA